MSPQQSQYALKEVSLDTFVEEAVEISKAHLKPLQKEGLEMALLAEKRESVLEVSDFVQKGNPYGLKDVCMFIAGSIDQGGYHLAVYVPLENLRGTAEDKVKASKAMVNFLTDLFCRTTNIFIENGHLVTPIYKEGIRKICANTLLSNDPLKNKNAPRGIFIDFQADLRHAKIDMNSKAPEEDTTGLYLWSRKSGKDISSLDKGKKTGLVVVEPKELTMEYLSRNKLGVGDTSKRVVINQELCGKPASEVIPAENKTMLDQFVYIVSSTFIREGVGITQYDAKREYRDASGACRNILEFYNGHVSKICNEDDAKPVYMKARDLMQSVQELSDFYLIMHDEITRKAEEMRILTSQILEDDRTDSKSRTSDLKELSKNGEALAEQEKNYQRDLTGLRQVVEDRYAALCRSLGFVTTPLFPGMYDESKEPDRILVIKPQPSAQLQGRA